MTSITFHQCILAELSLHRRTSLGRREEKPQIELPKLQLDFYRLHSLIVASPVSHYRNKVRFGARGNYQVSICQSDLVQGPSVELMIYSPSTCTLSAQHTRRANWSFFKAYLTCYQNPTLYLQAKGCLALSILVKIKAVTLLHFGDIPGVCGFVSWACCLNLIWSTESRF